MKQTLFTKSWQSPCKLNLFLQFVGQRDNGYHNLQSVFQILDYADTLDITVDPTINASDKIIFDCDDQALANADNLIVKAANALKAYAQKHNHSQPLKPLGANIYLHKKLPYGGGVGGGSSNCATALIGLNVQWGLNYPLETLAEIGLRLGADVPIFIYGQTAFVEGIGEIITPIELPEVWYLVIHPQCHVSTAEIFSDPLLTRNSKALKIRDLNAMGLPFEGFNTMQTLVCEAYPEVKKALEWLTQFSPNARMTGSGSCLFLPFDNEQEMSKIANRCKWSHFAAKGVNLSPLHQQL